MKEAFEKIKDFLKSKFDYCAEQAGMNLDAECGSEIASYFRERKELYLDRANIYGEVIREIEKVEAEYGNYVCEWKNEKGMFIQNPHTGRKFSNEPSMKNIYCNTCGKKIKVVE